MDEPIRVGIIGAGRVGVDWHLPDIRRAGAEVVALADEAPGRAARFAAERGVERAFDDWAALLDWGRVDAVAICTPPASHERIACAALAAGVHVYLEKPPALDAAAMQRITDAADAAPRCKVLVGSNGIYLPHARAVRRRIAGGELGEVYYVEAIKNLRWNVRRGWHRRRALAGGGVLMDSGAHRIDLAHYLLGRPAAASVTAQTFSRFADLAIPPARPGDYQLMDVAEGRVAEEPPCDVEDAVLAIVRFKGGATMLLRDMAVAHMPEEAVVRIFGTAGGAVCRPNPLFFRAGPDGLDQAEAPHGQPAGAHVPAWEHLLDCIRHDRPTDSPPRCALTLMRIIDAIYASSVAGGRLIPIGAST